MKVLFHPKKKISLICSVLFSFIKITYSSKEKKKKKGSLIQLVFTMLLREEIMNLDLNSITKKKALV
jgi:hypothetical protein